jgi:hypothetical protein
MRTILLDTKNRVIACVLQAVGMKVYRRL